MSVGKELLKTLVNRALRPFNYCVINLSYLERINQQRQLGLMAKDDLELLAELPEQSIGRILKMLPSSKSQLHQDLVVLSELEFKRGGFFVEFGATDGITLSNTYLLEKEFGWTGILAEPALRWHNELKRNRNAHVETKCVWRESGPVLTFHEVESEAELSTIDLYSASDHHREARKACKSYEVKTISLRHLLAKYNAPREIDYLSIDTEGSEYEILSNFDFDEYRFRVITCEHNFTPRREQIYGLLTGKGYVRKFENVSGFDDWYVRAA